MSRLISILQAALDGAEVKDLPDEEVREVIQGILDIDDEDLTEEEHCAEEEISRPTAKRWRKAGIGPRWYKTETGRIRYKRRWNRQWKEERKQ